MFWEGLLEAMEPVLQAGFLVAWEMVVSVPEEKRLQERGYSVRVERI